MDINNWKELRQKYFKECTQKDSVDGTKFRIDIAPHDLFEWFKKNLAALQPSTLPLIEDEKYIFPGDYWLKYVGQFEKLKEVWDSIPEPINILLRQQIDIFAGKYPFKSVQLIDKGEQKQENEK